jgi:type IV pilus assembly protein PilF
MLGDAVERESARRRTTTAFRPLILILGAILLTPGCSGSQRAGGVDPVRQSESEYDIARDLWLRRGQVREALEHALRAVDLDDENSEALHLVALLYLDFCARSPAECRLKEAEKAAQRALALKPDFREARNTLGVVLIHQRRPREAIAVLKPLSEDILYATPEKAWGNLGWAYFEAGEVDRAIDALRRSIAAQPLFCVGSFRLGLAYERRAEFASALAAFSRALETNAPECAQLQDAWWGRARVAEHLGQTDSIRADLERCIELSSSTGTGKNCRSMLDKLK